MGYMEYMWVLEKKTKIAPTPCARVGQHIWKEPGNSPLYQDQKLEGFFLTLPIIKQMYYTVSVTQAVMDMEPV